MIYYGLVLGDRYCSEKQLRSSISYFCLSIATELNN